MKAVEEKEDEMRRWMWVGAALVIVAAMVGIAVGAYHAGVNHGLAETGHAVQVIRYGHHWGFPFGIFLFPLFIIGLFLLLRGAFWGRHGGPGHHHGPGAWESRYDEWHRRQHEQEGGFSGGSAASGGAPGGPVQPSTA